MAPSSGRTCSVGLQRVFGPSLSAEANWYAVSSDWFYRPREFMASEHFRLFKDDILEISIYDLVDGTGARVNPSWFGSSRKKDLVVVATLFGIVGRALRRKNVDEDKFCGLSEFQVVREELNSLQLEKMAGSNYNFPAILPETPPSTPDEIGSNPTNAVSVSLGKPTIEALQDVEKTTGPRLKAKCAGKFAKDCLEVLRENLTSSGEDLGKALGYGLLYSGQDNEEFVRETISSALSTVAEKQGVRKAFSTLLTDNIYNEYVNSMRVPDWIQLYVKLSTKLPNRSWQTLLNFLNIGRSGVSLILRSFVSSMFYLT